MADETTEADSALIKSPGKALLFSVIPGGGQLYNESPIKAALFFGAFSYFTYEYVKVNNLYQDDRADQNLHRSRNDQVWLMALTWFLNIGDAYVEAQLWDFDAYEVSDESLPDDEEKPEEMEVNNDTK
jgi:hypothetical protein